MASRFLILYCLLLIPLGCSKTSQLELMKVPIGNEVFTLELQLDVQGRMRGLMNRDEVPKGKGMLFVFPDASERSFWMKNCLINIDIIFLDSRGTILSVYEMPAEMPQGINESDMNYESRLTHYWSYGPARFAIELREGSIERLGLRPNDQITLDLDLLRSLAR